MTSKEALRPEVLVTVRQVPLIATLAPIVTLRMSSFGNSI